MMKCDECNKIFKVSKETSVIEIIDFLLLAKQRELDHMNNVQETRLNKLQHQNPDAWKAVKWLRHNRMLFQKTIYEPMILSLNVSDQTMMKYVEFIIPKRDLLAMFIFEVKENFSNEYFFSLRKKTNRVPMIWNYSSKNVMKNKN